MNHHDIEMTSQLQAKSTAKSMIKNVSKPRARYREVKDLLRFFKKTDVAFIFPQLEGAMDTGKIKKSALNSGECLSRKEGTGPFHLINCPKLQMQLSSHHIIFLVLWISIMVHFSCSGAFHNGHSSCLGDFLYPPYCTIIIFACISKASCSGIPNKTVFEAIAFLFIMNLFGVGD